METTVTLETIGEGKLPDLFAAELARVLENITDPNTDNKSKRTITIAVSFKPNRDGDAAAVEVKCGSKLAGIMTIESKVFIGMQQGKLVAVENDPRQGTFDLPKPQPVANVSRINQKEG